jgi:hypothetical protein
VYVAGVPSRALHRWKNDAQDALDEIEEAHRAVGGVGRGRRYATLQVNHAYVTLLSSQFQGFCRDLHTEAVAVFVGAITPAVLRAIVRNQLVQGRKLDSGNPNPGNLGSDFGRLGMAFWPAVTALDRRNPVRQAALETLNTWRNAVAHQDWSTVGPNLRLNQVQAWRAACRALATHFDAGVGTYLAGLVGAAPW